MSNHDNRNGGNKTPHIEVSDNLPTSSTKPVVADEGLSIESLVTTEFGREVAEEAFANELVVICVADSTSEEANPLPWLTVGEQRQFIPRGVNIAVKRKFVEVLARCKETKYRQHVPDPMNPENRVMVPKTALAYPFSVIEDKNPKGQSWLRAILNEAA